MICFIPRIFILLLFCVISGPALLAEDVRKSQVVVDLAKSIQLAPTSLYSGLVLSKNNVRLPAELAGRLTDVAEVGDRFKQGEIVARIDDTFLQQQRVEELAIIRSEEARLALHNKDVQRYQRLIKRNNIAQSELDQSILDQALARSNINAAKARLAQIEERIRRSIIRAPFAGVVSERFIQKGEWSESGAAIVRIVDTENLEIQVNVPGSIVSLLSIGDTLTVIHQDQLIPAKLFTVVRVSNNSSRLFELRMAPQRPLPAGSLVRVRVPNAQTRQVTVVHRDALVLRKGSTSVFRINANDIAEQIQVEAGIGDGEYIEVIGAIQDGDRVVTRGGERLRPGTAVTISMQSALQ